MTLGTLTRQAATFLVAAVASGLNVLVAGGTQGNPANPQSALYMGSRGSPEGPPCMVVPDAGTSRDLNAFCAALAG